MTSKQSFSKFISAAALAAALLSGSSAVFAQVKIGTNPTTINAANNLEVEAANNNKMVVQKSNGNVGIGNPTPTNKLHVTDTADPLKLEGLTTGIEGNASLVVDATGIVKKAPPTLTPVTRFLASMSANGTQISTTGGLNVLFMAVDFETIPGSSSISNSNITVPRAGYYQILSNIHTTDVVAGGNIQYCVYYTKNGAAIPGAESCGRNVSSTGRVGSSFAHVIYLNAGDKIGAYIDNIATPAHIIGGSSLQVIELR